MNNDITKVLGNTVDYPQTYDPSILVREARQNNRNHLNIKNDNLPFFGFDNWNCYEVSTMTANGAPLAGYLKIVYPSNSEYIVESKSLKLYLNSFNMERKLFADCTDRYSFAAKWENVIIEDLSKLLNTDVDVRFFTTSQVTDTFNLLNNVNSVRLDVEHVFSPLWVDYVNVVNSSSIEDHINLSEVVFDKFTEDGSLLKTYYKSNNIEKQFYRSSLLKSNCKVTRQPDWGDVFIHIDSENIVDQLSLLKYIVSFRDECHFHEEICETIFTRLNEVYNPVYLSVVCLYTRRGGIDICPVRVKNNYRMDDYSGFEKYLAEVTVPHYKTVRQ